MKEDSEIKYKEVHKINEIGRFIEKLRELENKGHTVICFDKEDGQAFSLMDVELKDIIEIADDKTGRYYLYHKDGLAL